MATTKSGSDTVLSLSRTFAAPREAVFRAWTEPEALRNWWGAADGFTAPIAEVDLRVGGRYRLGMKPPDKDVVHVSTGVFHEVQRPSRLVYTWSWEGGDGSETLVTVEFHDRGAATEVVLTHERFTDAAMRDQHAQGWNGCFDQLTKYLAK
ncbi:MAG: hypothetical protein A2Z07_09495 [Armatimonadetes bacterium RBG_16_67_12]|nr:MAG: hypothetical protein A2Z07_09495 [Armatimonadetes bacterium RBG_16_67_12]